MTKDIGSDGNVALPSGIIQNRLKTDEILRKTAKEKRQQRLTMICVIIVKVLLEFATHLTGSSGSSSDDANNIDRNLTPC